MDGFLIIDKPPGMTSAQAVAAVKRITRAAKVGHTGTLDPFATGVLVCCLGAATKLSTFFLHGDKGYEGVMRLGLETDTLDPTGRVTRESEVPPLTKGEIEAVFARYTGLIMQTPPAYSALKHEGKPLYKLARAGKPVVKPAREVCVRELGLAGLSLPEVSFVTRCSGGTYVRSLVSDIGRDLGCGAHLSALRRTENGGFTMNDAVGLEELARLSAAGELGTRLVGMSEGLRGMPEIFADAALTRKIAAGRPLFSSDFPGAGPLPPAGFLKVLDDSGRLLAVLSPEPGTARLTYAAVLAGGADADQGRRFTRKIKETRNQKEATQSGSHP